MELVCDYRESHIINQLENILKQDNTKYNNILLKKENLDLGDFKIGNILIERKTHQDLASSILDGRYKEQCSRLKNYLIENSDTKIYYFIEGNFDLFIKKHNIDKDKLISCIMSLSYEQNFNIIMTKHINETCDFLIKFCLKYFNKYNKLQNTDNNQNNNNIACIVQQNHKKKEQINKENIGIIMLSNIPYISYNIACQLLEPFENNIYLFIQKINEDSEYLDKLKLKSKDNKVRKLSKNIIVQLKTLLI